MSDPNTVSITTSVGAPAELYVPPPPPVDLSVSAALRYLKLTPGSTVSISDSAVNIQKNLGTLQSLNARITAVQASSDASRVLTVSYKDYAADKGILAKWSNNASHQFILNDVTAQAAGTLWNSDFIKSLTIKDTAINLQNNFDSLVNIQSQDIRKITALTQTNTSALITLNTAQYTSGRDSGLFAKLNKGIQNLAITNATVNDVVGDIGASLRLGFATSVKSISIIDNTDNIDHGINDLQRVGMKIKTIVQNNLAIDNTLELDAKQIKNNASVLGKIITGYQLSAQNTAASQLSSMLANRKVISIDVKDTASNISRNWDKINGISTSLNFVEVSDTDTPIKIKASQLAVSQDLIAKFKVPDEYVRPDDGLADLPTGDFKLEIAEATASQVDELQASQQITAFNIKDTAENIGLYLADLKNSIDSVDGKLQFIKTANTSQIEMSFSTYSDPDIAVLLGKVNKGLYNIKLTDVTVSNLASITIPTLTSNLLFNDKAIESIEIVDSVDSVQDNLDLLNAAGSRIKSIDLGYNTDNDVPVIAPLTIDAKDFINRQRVLEKINGGYKVDIEKATIKQALSLASNPHVQSIDIEDSSSNISSYWNQLLDINEQLDDITISGARVSITADQYELGLEADIQDKILQTEIPVTFAIKNANIDQALNLVTEDEASKYISSVEIKDSGVNIVGNMAELKLLLADATITTSLFQVDPKNSLEITYSEFEEFDSVFDAISGQSYKLTVSGASVDNALNMAAANPVNPVNKNLNYRNVSSINIEDSTTEISENINSLLTMGKKLTSINLTNKTDNISITHEQYLKGKSVLDRINDDYTLDINDAAVYNVSSILNNTKVKALSVYGSASYISKAWDSLVGFGSKLKTILNTTQYDPSSAITKAATSISLNISQWLNSSTLIDKISAQGSNKFAIFDASVEEAKGIVGNAAQNALVTDLKVTDTSAVIDQAFDTANAASLTLLSNSKVTAIHLADPAVPMDLDFSQIDLVSAADNISVLDKIKTDFALNVDNATVTQAFTLQTSLGAIGSHKYSDKVQSIDISDTGTNVQTDFDNLKGLTRLDAIGLNDANQVMTFSASKILEPSSISLFKKITQSPYFLDATSTSMSQLTQLYPFDNTVIDTVEPMIDSAILPNLRNFYVLDSAANVSSSYNELIALGPNLKGLGLSSGSDLDINYAQWQASKATLLALTSGAEAALPKATYAFNLSDVSAQDAVGSTAGNLTTNPVNSLYTTNTSSVFSDALVKSVTVKDTADQISANWDALQIEFTTTNRAGYSATKLANLVFIDNNELTLSAAQVVKTHGTGGSGPVYQELLDKVGPTNGVVVRDTAANVKAYWDDLAALYGNGEGNLGQIISRIELTSANPKVELTLAQQADDGDALIQILEGKEFSVETIS
jgi:hypothetical protein